jgi:hypothetical protein
MYDDEEEDLMHQNVEPNMIPTEPSEEDNPPEDNQIAGTLTFPSRDGVADIEEEEDVQQEPLTGNVRFKISIEWVHEDTGATITRMEHEETIYHMLRGAHRPSALARAKDAMGRIVEPALVEVADYVQRNAEKPSAPVRVNQADTALPIHNPFLRVSQ